MKPVDQTKFAAEGNCFTACVASLLELSLEDVPYFNARGAEWRVYFLDWCEERNLRPAFLEGGPAPAGYSIVGGPCMRDGERSPRLHACIALDGEVVHDPNPCRAGLIEIRDYIVLIPTVNA